MSEYERFKRLLEIKEIDFEDLIHLPHIREIKFIDKYSNTHYWVRFKARNEKYVNHRYSTSKGRSQLITSSAYIKLFLEVYEIPAEDTELKIRHYL